MDEVADAKDPIENLVFVDYTIIFDPEKTWAYMVDFETDLADFFAAYGLEAKIIKTANDSPFKRILYIRKNEILQRPIMKEEIQTQPQTMKQFLGQKRQKRNFQGQFRGVNK